MADKKISELTALTGANTASNDVLAIVDTSAVETKKITVDELQKAPLSSGTANGVAYLNASKVLTTGSALTFDGTNLVIGRDVYGADGRLNVWKSDGTGNIALWRLYNGTNNPGLLLNLNETSNDITFNTTYSLGSNPAYVWQQANVEKMRLTSTGLGIGTSSPASKLHVNGTIRAGDNGISNGSFTIFNATNDAYGVISTPSGAELRIESTYGATAGYKPVTFYTGGSEQMRLTSTGLGIGTSSPSARLTLQGSASSRLIQLYNGGSTADYSAIGAQYGSGSAFCASEVRFGNQDIGSGTGFLAFATGTNSATERARIDASGNFIHQVNGTAPTLGTNGTMSFELTSNTSLKIVVRGSDGVTRSATLTLA